MVEIETRFEAARRDPDYAGAVFSAAQRADKAHRQYVGGRWDEMGRAQLDFLVRQGLRPDQRLLDVGCGSLRAGRHLVDHLDPGHYYGIDVNRPAIEAGYEDELNDAQRDRLPAANLRATDRFHSDFGVLFDMAIAQSVFTHVTLNNARLCLHRVAQAMAPGGRFFVTFFEAPPGTPVDKVLAGPRRFTERNPYWYYRADMRWLVRDLPWRFDYLGDWGHPMDQRMAQYTRLGEEEFAEKRSRVQRADRSPGPSQRADGLAPRLRAVARRVRR